MAECRRKKVQELEKKMAELRGKITYQDKIVKMKTEIEKKTESDKFTKWRESKEKELNRLKDQNRKQVKEVTRLKMWHSKQEENVFKRKMEEAFAVNKRLKVMDYVNSLLQYFN